MGIGASIFMLAAGAIIAFGLDVRVGWLDLDVVGWVLMAAGAVGIILTLTIFSSRRRTIVTPPPPTVARTREREVIDEPVVSEYDRPL